MDARKIISPSHRHLAKETIMRIEVSLSSRRSSVVVFNTTARLVALGRGEWSSIAYGAPCILLIRETTATDSPFQVRFVIAELESGLAIWEEELSPAIDYTELQPGFHSFTLDGQTLAVQFADPSESASFYDSLKMYLAQKQNTDQLLEERKKKSESKSSKKSKKQQKSDKRLSKLDISLPCEFRHLSGITAGQTDQCQQELEGSIERHHRSVSLGAISSQNQIKQRGRIPDEMNDGTLYVQSTEDEEPISERFDKNESRGKFKFSSLRLTRKKPLLDLEVKEKKELSISSPRHNLTPQIMNTPVINPSLDHQQEMTKFLPQTNSNNIAVVASQNFSSNVMQGWKEDTRMTHSSKSTPHHMHNNTVSPNHAQETLKPLPSVEARSSLHSESLLHLTPITLPSSPQRLPLQPISPPPLEATTNIMDKYKHIKPSFSTYDTLLPLDPKDKPTTTLSPPGKIAAPKPHTKTPGMQRPVPIENPKPKPAPIESPKANQIPFDYPKLSPVPFENRQSRPFLSLPGEGSFTTQSSSVQRSVSPPQASTPSDLDQLTEDLSRVLREFDELIAPQSPFETASFSYQQHRVGRETMV